jgi:hypothetical protein
MKPRPPAVRTRLTRLLGDGRLPHRAQPLLLPAPLGLLAGRVRG